MWKSVRVGSWRKRVNIRNNMECTRNIAIELERSYKSSILTDSLGIICLEPPSRRTPRPPSKIKSHDINQDKGRKTHGIVATLNQLLGIFGMI